MKLVIENLGHPSVLSGKPVALLGVASGAIGAVIFGAGILAAAGQLATFWRKPVKEETKS